MSDSDSEDDAQMARMRAAVADHSFAMARPDVQEAANKAAALAALKAANAAADAAADAAVTAASSAVPAADGSARLASPNPFAALLAPPPSPLLSLPAPAVPAALKSNPYRTAFLSSIRALQAERTRTLERRRRNALHGLSSKRNSGDNDDDGLASTAPRMLNEFERKLLRNLEAMLSRDLVFEECWPALTQEQQLRIAQQFADAEQAFRLTARAQQAPIAAAPTEGAVASAANDGKMTDVAVHDAVAAGVKATGEEEDAAAKKARKQARKEQRAREAAAAATLPASTTTAPAAAFAVPAAASPATASAAPVSSPISSSLPLAASAPARETAEQRAARKEAKRAHKEAKKRKHDAVAESATAPSFATNATVPVADPPTNAGHEIAEEADGDKSHKKQKKHKKEATTEAAQ
jgi:hypothetical protein